MLPRRFEHCVCVVAILLSCVSAYADELSDWMGKAAQASEKGHFRAAEKHYRAVLERSPSHVSAMYGLALALHAREQDQEAIHWLEAVVNAQPNFQKAYYLLGQIYEQQGDMTRATAAYRTYVAIAPLNVPPDPDIRIKLRKLGVF